MKRTLDTQKLIDYLQERRKIARKAQGLDGGKAEEKEYWIAYYGGQERLAEMLMVDITEHKLDGTVIDAKGAEKK